MKMPEKITVNPDSKEWDLGYLHCYRQFVALNKGTVCVDEERLRYRLKSIYFMVQDCIDFTVDEDVYINDTITYLTKGEQC